jgi:hypothetical protein
LLTYVSQSQAGERRYTDDVANNPTPAGDANSYDEWDTTRETSRVTYNRTGYSTSETWPTVNLQSGKRSVGDEGVRDSSGGSSASTSTSSDEGSKSGGAGGEGPPAPPSQPAGSR